MIVILIGSRYMDYYPYNETGVIGCSALSLDLNEKGPKYINHFVMTKSFLKSVDICYLVYWVKINLL